MAISKILRQYPSRIETSNKIFLKILLPSIMLAAALCDVLLTSWKMAYSKTRNGGTAENGIPEYQIRNGKTRIRNTKSGTLKPEILNLEHQIRKGKTRNTNLWNHSSLQSSIIVYTCHLWTN